MRTRVLAEVRFWVKVDHRGPEECWSWLGTTNGIGYGMFGVYREPQPWRMRMMGAHRFSYELANGPVPPGLVIDHLCRNRGCVNPRHMEAVTMRENTERGNGPTADLADRTHCRRGHAFTNENTYRWGGHPYRHDGKPSARQCKTCKREYLRAWRAAKAAAEIEPLKRIA